MIIKNKYSILYIFFAFLFTWSLWTPAFTISHLYNYPLPLINNLNDFFQSGVISNLHLIAILLFSFAVFGPFVSAFLVAYLENKSEGTRALFSAIINFKFNKKWLIFVFGFPAVIYLIAALTNSVLEKSPILTFLYPLSFILPLFIYQIFSSGMEEPGWRGYLLPKMLQDGPAEQTAWRLGIIWSIWHWPVVIYLSTGQNMVIILSSLAGNVMAMVAITYIYVWIYQNTKSLPLLILFHAFSNLIPLYTIGQAQSGPAFLLPIALTWITAIWLSKKYGKELKIDH